MGRGAEGGGSPPPRAGVRGRALGGAEQGEAMEARIPPDPTSLLASLEAEGAEAMGKVETAVACLEVVA